MTYPAEKRRDADSWHLDKKVPLSLILALLVQSGMVIWAVADIKKDVEYLKLQVHTQDQRDNRQDAEMKEAMSLLRESLGTLNAKMDRLIERGTHK